MVAALSVASLCLGVALSGYAPRASGRTALYEGFGGSFVVGGLFLLGAGLPLFR